MTQGITKKIYLELTPPTEEDNRSAQRRVLDAIEAAFDADFSPGDVRSQTSSGDSLNVKMPLSIMRTLHPLCEEADWKLMASLAWDGRRWEITALEAGDTSEAHYGLAVDLGSTTIVMQLVDCNRGTVIAQESAYNRQIAFGEDILTRIFYSKDNPERLEEIRRATIDTIVELMETLEQKTGIPIRTDMHSNAGLSTGTGTKTDTGFASGAGQCISMVVAGNTTMTHFLFGLDAFCVFSSPYAVSADQPGFLKADRLDIPLPGYVYCYPGKANYLGGDIISGMVAIGMHRRESISLFFDVGTNGELVVGNKEFLLCGAGAAGPALEGGVVKTGMRAAEGAVQHIKLVKCDRGRKALYGDEDELIVNIRSHGQAETCYQLVCDVIGGGAAKGICGSGIIDLISELFLHGILDLRGKLVPEKSDAVVWRKCEEDEKESSDSGNADLNSGASSDFGCAQQESYVDKTDDTRRMEGEGEYAFCYAPGIYFYQSDIHEFIRTKAAAYTMMEYLLSETGMSLDEVSDFYMAGAFGSHVDKTSAVNIGMYPDVNPEKIHAEGNTSIAGARMLLLDREIAEELPGILDLMTYVQFGAVEDFLEKMTAASALPHTDLERYPSVKKRLMIKKRQQHQVERYSCDAHLKKQEMV
ncbi:MAG: ASKHA domain-containing protein [Lachnospiraceae bacterium]|nr:ASKHA domain-containing protein [Lachnospiraceae bacterium]